VLIVRDRFLETGTIIPRARWRFVTGPNGLPKIHSRVFDAMWVGEEALDVRDSGGGPAVCRSSMTI
jgi:hypothetical protein